MRKALSCIVLTFFLCTPILSFAAPNKIQMVPGTRLTFTDSGSTGGDIDLANLGTGAGKYSARYDKNALVSPSGAMPYLWQVDVSIQLSGTNVVTDTIEVYIVQWTSTTLSQGNLGTTKATLATDKRKNLTLALMLAVDQVTTATTMIAVTPKPLELPGRYLSVAVWNASTLSFVNTAGVSSVGLTPLSLELQANVPLDYDRHPAVPALALAA